MFGSSDISDFLVCFVSLLSETRDQCDWMVDLDLTSLHYSNVNSGGLYSQRYLLPQMAVSHCTCGWSNLCNREWSSHTHCLHSVPNTYLERYNDSSLVRSKLGNRDRGFLLVLVAGSEKEEKKREKWSQWLEHWNGRRAYAETRRRGRACEAERRQSIKNQLTYLNINICRSK